MTGEPALHVLEDPESTSRAAAEAIAGALALAVAARGRADWATTGGSAPVGIYRALAESGLRDRVPWAAVHTWWGDDRFVTDADPLSNVRPLEAFLLPGVPLARDHLHVPTMTEAITNHLAVDWVARQYEAELRAADLEMRADGFPVLDVVLVGIGGDGHVLSAFPGSPLFDVRAWVSAVPAPTHIEPHVARISLHPRILEAARLPMIVAHGAGKAADRKSSCRERV